MFEFTDFGPSKLPEGFVESLTEKTVEELIKTLELDRDYSRIYIDAVCGELELRPKTAKTISALMTWAENRDKYAKEILVSGTSKDALFKVIIAPVSRSLRLEAVSCIESFLSREDAHIFDPYLRCFSGDLYCAVSALRRRLFGS